MTLKVLLKIVTHLTFQQTQPKDKITNHDILVRLWDVIAADMFTLNNKQYLCIVDYHSKFLIIKKTTNLSADSLILMWKLFSFFFFFAENGVPKKIMSESDRNFILDKFKTFCKNLNIEQAFLSSYHHQSNEQVEACIKFEKAHTKNVLISGVTHT